MHIFPYEIVDVEPQLNAELLQYFKGERTGFVQVGPEKYFFPHKYKLEAKLFYNFQARPEDIWVATCPRSGTTWTQELVWMVANKLDFRLGKSQPLTKRFPFFEYSSFVHPELKAELLFENKSDKSKQEFIQHISAPGYETLDAWPVEKKRFIKTHLPFSLMPPSVMDQKCKIIYVERNPKDVAVSYYHLNRLFRAHEYIGDFKRFWNYFSRGLLPWLPYYSHVKEAHACRHLPNVLFLNYEEMASDLKSVILKVAAFLDCPISAADLSVLTEHLDIRNFRENPSVNGSEMADIGMSVKGEAGFVRRGGNGKQEEIMADLELRKSMDQWVERSVEGLK